MKPLPDRCAECFELLKPHPFAGRYRCRCNSRNDYWSEAVPEGTSTKDKARLVSKYGRRTLYYYGGKGCS